MIFYLPEDGEFRYKSGFALFPKEAGNVVIWLEKYYLKQRYYNYKFGWYNVEFVTKEEYLNCKR